MLPHFMMVVFFAAYQYASAETPDRHQSQGFPVSVIPQPEQVSRGTGFLRLKPSMLTDAQLDGLQSAVIETTGTSSVLAGEGISTGVLNLRLDNDAGTTHSAGYALTVSTDGIRLRAPEREGLFYGLQTVRQLLQDETTSARSISTDHLLPCLTILDKPRFQWRGLMLDCSRTFQSVDYIRKTIDRMAFYKMNVLHLHLTDDQGWRLEIARYPELTVKGARFPEEYGEPDAYQGYYSQKEMKELVTYARQRNITIVPEIEMPGHCLAALSCFPDLACTAGPFKIPQKVGIEADVYCAGNDRVFQFLENVLEEVLEIFPSQFIHIGGDEVPKDRWKACAKCQSRMRDERLTDEHQLQSYFIKRIERFLNARGRRLIGWDEIIDGGLAPNAAVMSWRGMQGGITAASAGHYVIMSPTSHCYFDYPYDRIDTRKAYSFDPLEGMKPEQARFVLGLQANFWSHIDREPGKVDRQLFPRLLAIAERGWSPAPQREWEHFRHRLLSHRRILENLGIAPER